MLFKEIVVATGATGIIAGELSAMGTPPAGPGRSPPRAHRLHHRVHDLMEIVIEFIPEKNDGMVEPSTFRV
jgi:hypothetical protein